jgi:hypothetical protein
MREPFHDAFEAALAGDAAALAPWSDASDLEARLSVYRNTIASGLADALAAQFPTVLRIVGERWLRAAAITHAGEVRPTRASLIAYGQDFPDWLAAFPPAAAVPYLPQVARLDLLFTAADMAADAEPLAAAAVGALDADGFARHRLVLHPAAQFAWFGAGVPSLWLALQRDPPPAAFEVPETAEGLLMTRPHLSVAPMRLSRGAHALLAACRDGESLADAAVAALDAEPELPLSHAFAELIERGAFCRLVALEPA